jgi:ankyrin repeat protein
MGPEYTAMIEAKKILGIKDLTAVNKDGQNALHLAAYSGSAAAIAEAKTILGLDLTAVDKYGSNAMHFAASSGSAAAMKEAKTITGLNLTAVNNNGDNAMHLAVRSKNPAAIFFLRQLSLTYSLGFDPNTPNHAGETPFSLADNSAEIPLRAALRNALTVPVEPLEVPNDHEEKQSPSLSKR